MKRIFVDSSVLFSAGNSSKGHARDLVNMAIRGEVVLVVSTLKDAPIVAAARKAKVDFLVTLSLSP